MSRLELGHLTLQMTRISNKPTAVVEDSDPVVVLVLTDPTTLRDGLAARMQKSLLLKREINIHGEPLDRLGRDRKCEVPTVVERRMMSFHPSQFFIVLLSSVTANRCARPVERCGRTDNLSFNLMREWIVEPRPLWIAVATIT